MDKFVDVHVDTDMEGDSLPYLQQTMMVNIVRKMKQELETQRVCVESSSWMLTRDSEMT